MSLLRIEFRKMLHARSFWVLSALYLLSMAVVFYFLQEYVIRKVQLNGDLDKMVFSHFHIYNFPDIWNNLAYVCSFFFVFPSIMVIIFTTNEFSYRTIRQHIIDGMSRDAFILSKAMTVTIFSVVSTFFLFVLGLVIGFANTPDAVLVDCFEGMHYLGLYLIQMLIYLMFALACSLLLKRSGLTIGLFLIYSWFGERILEAILPGSIGKYLPLNSADNLVPFPFTKYFEVLLEDGKTLPTPTGGVDLVVAMLWLAVLGAGAWLWVRKQDL
ncbi:MAG: ABC transporter permease [Flavobacteriales bacterium]|nr:ABC transporter permease [Flavobacteriales bacterium]